MKRMVVLFVFVLLFSAFTGSALASHGYYNSRVVPVTTYLKYMEGNSWYTSSFPYMAVHSTHEYTGGRDQASYGNSWIARAHAAHYHSSYTGAKTSSSHSFLNHGYWYYRNSSTTWVW